MRLLIGEDFAIGVKDALPSLVKHDLGSLFKTDKSNFQIGEAVLKTRMAKIVTYCEGLFFLNFLVRIFFAVARLVGHSSHFHSWASYRFAHATGASTLKPDVLIPAAEKIIFSCRELL